MMIQKKPGFLGRGFLEQSIKTNGFFDQVSGDSLCIELVDTLIRQIEVHHNAHILVFIESETAGLYENGNQFMRPMH